MQRSRLGDTGTTPQSVEYRSGLFLPSHLLQLKETYQTFNMAPLQRLLTAALLPIIASSQFVPAPTDLTSTTGWLDLPVRYKEVPDGICELTPGVKSYSGYVDIEENQVSAMNVQSCQLPR